LGAASATVAIAACGGTGAPTRPSTSRASSPVALGRRLYVSQGCEDCHSLDGSRGTGPSYKGLYGSRVHLASARTVIATAAYLTEHIVDPNAVTVSGYPGEVMAEAIAGDHLASKPSEVRALVAFIRSLR